MTQTTNYKLKFIFVCAIFSLLSSCKNESIVGSKDALNTEISGISINQNQFDSSKFELGKVEERSFSKLLLTNGTIHIPEKSKATVSTLISGTVGAINLLEGQWVKKGQELFRVTNPELINIQESYLVATGELEYLNEEYKREQQLTKENLTTKNKLLKAKSELSKKRAIQGALMEKLKLYGINANNLSTSNLVSSLAVRSPISGYISSINVTRGMYIEPHQAALFLANTSQIFLELSVLEKDALLLKKEQELTFTIQGNSSKIYRAKIFLINKSINDNRTISIHCTILEKAKELVPGMYANAKIVLEDYMANALPESALVKMDEHYYALTLRSNDGENMTFDKAAIRTGEVQDGYIELKDIPNESARFLIKGAYFLIQ